MQPLRTRTLILISLTATAVLYAALAFVLGSNEPWLRSVAGADASLAERLAFPLRRAVRDAAFIVAVGMALYVTYQTLASGVLATRRIASEYAGRSQVAREMFLF